MTNVAGTFTNRGGFVFPANAQTLAYDADGNLTFDGIWNYQWDGENRLISMNMTNSMTGLAVNAQGLVTNRMRLDFAYDYLGRRIQKTVSVWNSSTNGFQASTVNSFVYDGWNLVAIINTQSIVQSFVWGNDLSGTMTKAGGVGGLLIATLSGTNYFAGYDGNGNLTAFISAGDKSVGARYEYSPYGQLLRQTGLLATQVTFRFSTKYWDSESGLIYYNARYYSPSLGKWIGRDPTTDQVLLNLYLFCHNNPIARFDLDGRSDGDDLTSLLCAVVINAVMTACDFVGTFAIAGAESASMASTDFCIDATAVASRSIAAVVGSLGPRAAAAYSTAYYYYATHPEEAATVGSVATEWATGMDGSPTDCGNDVEVSMEASKTAAEKVLEQADAFADYWANPN